MISGMGLTFTLEELPVQTGADVQIEMVPWFKPKSEIQAKSIEYLSDPKSGDLRGLSLQPGGGKTAALTATLSNIGKRSLVCMDGLVEQWDRAVRQFTTLTDDDIYIIKGGPSITKLLLQCDTKIFPKIILGSSSTIRQYCLDKDAYANYPSFDEFCNRLRIGVRAIDEAHLNFYLNYIMDLRLNVATTICLTATFDRTNPQIKAIFDKHYPPEIRFGEDVYKKYTHIYEYSYATGADDVPSSAYTTPRGYSHSKLEKWLLDKRSKSKLPQIYKTVYKPLVDAHYINEKSDGQKLLVLCSKQDMCEWLCKQFRRDFPDLVSEIYIDESPDSVLETADIIVSTPGSAGTGTDIAKLKTVLLTLSSGSDVLNEQILGRLRELYGEHPILVVTWWRAIPKHVEYHNRREILWILRGLSYNKCDL